MAKAKPKAKAKNKQASPAVEESDDARRYKVEDGLRTLNRAEEIKGDPQLMRDISKHADDQAEVASRAAGMVKSGLISPKQQARMDAKAGPSAK